MSTYLARRLCWECGLNPRRSLTDRYHHEDHRRAAGTTDQPARRVAA